MKKKLKIVAFYSGTDSDRPALDCMIGHLETFHKFLPTNCSFEIIDVDAESFRFDDATVKRLTKERSIVVLLTSPALEASAFTQSKQMQSLIEQSGATGAHIFPIYCVSAKDPSALPWAKFQGTPAKKAPISSFRDHDFQADYAHAQLSELVNRRLNGTDGVPEVAVFAAPEDDKEVELSLAPMLKLAGNLNFRLSWQILPGEIPAEFYAKAAKAKKQIVFLSSRALADDGIWDYVLTKEPGADQTRLIVYLYPCARERLEFEDFDNTRSVPGFADDKQQTVGGKNSHSLWLQAYTAIADLIAKS